MKSFALSRLAQQRLQLGPKFGKHFPNDWLVWEPGAWVVPKGSVSTTTTAEPMPALKTRPRNDDPLCFVLAARLDGSSCSIGRAEGNELVLSDETVSRNHCFFAHTGKTWVVTCTAEAKQLVLDGKKVKSSESAAIRSGQKLELGHVVLTLLDCDGMLARIDGLPLSKV